MASPWSYLDSGASAQKPRAVIEAMDQVMSEGYCQRSPGPIYYFSQQRPIVTRACAAPWPRFLNAAERSRRSSLPAMPTEAINLVAHSFGQGLSQGEGDEIIVSEMEHHANIVPWQLLRDRTGIVLKVAPIDRRRRPQDGRTGVLDWSAHQAGRDHPCVQRPGHGHADQGDRAPGPCPGCPAPGRRLQGRGPRQGRRPGLGRRLLCLHRPQALRPDRDRRALRQGRLCSRPCRPSLAAAT